MNSNGINSKLAFALTLLIPTAIVAWLWIYRATPFDELPFVIFWIGIYVVPFWVFLLAGNRSIFLWVMQATLTLLMWGWMALIAHAEPGVNFGAALALLFGPAITGIISFGTHDSLSRRADRRLGR